MKTKSLTERCLFETLKTARKLIDSSKPRTVAQVREVVQLRRELEALERKYKVT